MRLVTERLVLREFVETDWPAMLAYHCDARYLAHYPQNAGSTATLRRLLGMFIGWQQERPRYRWQLAITLHSSDEVIGTCGIRLTEPGAAQAELGYGLSSAHWHQGYATEAARRMLSLAFDELGVHRVGARVVASNAASIALLERLGFASEGRLREYERLDDARWCDALLYGLLDSEWAAAAR